MPDLPVTCAHFFFCPESRLTFRLTAFRTFGQFTAVADVDKPKRRVGPVNNGNRMLLFIIRFCKRSRRPKQADLSTVLIMSAGAQSVGKPALLLRASARQHWGR